MKIAILEPDIRALQCALKMLSSAGHLCHGVSRDNVLKSLLDEVSIDLVILDWEAPGSVQHDTLRWMHCHRPAIRVVLAVAPHTCEDDLVSGLETGADIYVGKPVGNPESLARIHALGRHVNSVLRPGDSRFAFGAFHFHLADNSVKVRGRRIRLTPKEFSLALLLFRNVSQPLARVQIAFEIWGDDRVADSRTIDTHVSSIRRKLGLHLANGCHLVPIYGHGYQLERVQRLHRGWAESPMAEAMPVRDPQPRIDASPVRGAVYGQASILSG